MIISFRHVQILHVHLFSTSWFQARILRWFADFIDHEFPP